MKNKSRIYNDKYSRNKQTHLHQSSVLPKWLYYITHSLTHSLTHSVTYSFT